MLATILLEGQGSTEVHSNRPVHCRVQRCDLSLPLGGRSHSPRFQILAGKSERILGMQLRAALTRVQGTASCVYFLGEGGKYWTRRPRRNLCCYLDNLGEGGQRRYFNLGR